MRGSFDAVVVGAGFAGASTAYHLAKRGLQRLLVLEQESLPGQHASGRNASLAFQQLSNGAEARLAIEGRAFIAAPPAGFCDHPLLRPCGSLLLAGEEGAAHLAGIAREAAALGVRSEALTPAEARRRVPLLDTSDFAGARWTPSDGVVDIRALLQSYLAGARAAGVEIRCDTPITGIDTGGGRVSAVHTHDGRIDTPLLINAAGAWAGEIGRLAGVGTRTLAPRRRHMYRAATELPIDAEWPFVWHDDIDVYFRPEDGLLLTSPCDATPHPSRAPEVDEGVQALLFDKLHRAFPRLADVRIVTRWACLRTFTADESFLIGADPELGGFVWVAGLGGHGMTTSPAVGRLGAQAATGQLTPELEPFTPARFAGMKPVEELRQPHD